MKKFLFVVAIVSIFLTGCSMNSNVNDGEENVKLVFPNNNENQNETQEPLVVKLFEEGEYKLPKINIDSEDARNVNKHFEEVKKQILSQKDFDSDNSGEWDNWYESAKYKATENKDILSIVVKYNKGYIASFTEYDVYNFDLKTKKLLTTTELNEKLNHSDEAFNARLGFAYERNVSKEEKNSIDSTVGFDGIEKTYDESIAEFKKTKIDDWKTYIDYDGTYHIFLKKLATAGAMGAEYLEDVCLWW